MNKFARPIFQLRRTTKTYDDVKDILKDYEPVVITGKNTELPFLKIKTSNSEAGDIKVKQAEYSENAGFANSASSSDKAADVTGNIYITDESTKKKTKVPIDNIFKYDSTTGETSVRVTANVSSVESAKTVTNNIRINNSNKSISDIFETSGAAKKATNATNATTVTGSIRLYSGQVHPTQIANIFETNGAAKKATKINTLSNIGSSSNPVYVNSSGSVTACDQLYEQEILLTSNILINNYQVYLHGIVISKEVIDNTLVLVNHVYKNDAIFIYLGGSYYTATNTAAQAQRDIPIVDFYYNYSDKTNQILIGSSWGISYDIGSKLCLSPNFENYRSGSTLVNSDQFTLTTLRKIQLR